MNRRNFMMISGSALALSAFGKSFIKGDNFQEQTAKDIRFLFESKDPAVLQLLDEVYQKCILGKIFPAEEPLKHNWIGPGGGYRGQWIWDTMFVVDLLSILPGKEKIIRDVFQNYWDFQIRWNEQMPGYAHDMIPCMIVPGKQDWVKFPAYSQIPILAWGIERVYKRNGDKELIRQCLEPLERFHEWYWRERDVTNIGLIAVGSYSGVTQHARFETFDYECNLDDLKMTLHPSRKDDKGSTWYGDICAAGNTSYLVIGERSLIRLAQIVGDDKMAARRNVRIEKAVKAMNTIMWDEKAGTYLSVKRDDLEKVQVATIGSWLPLLAGVPTKVMAKRMAEVLQSPNWNTPLPVPTVDRNDPRWKSDGFWRGDVWPATNYQIASGLALYGYSDLAASIADKTVANAMRNGISEHYDSMSGKKLGVEFLGMTCTVITMILDGLCHNYKLKVSNTK